MRTTVFGGLLVGLIVAAPVAWAETPSPEEALGHPVGADRKLVPYPQVLDYLRSVAAASDRVSIEVAGTSTLGNEMPIVVLTSAQNQDRLDTYRTIARRLALPYGLSAGEARAQARSGKAIALVTCTIHSTEVGCTQMAMEFVHEFATTEDPERLGWMDEAILLLMPSINPDGQVMIVDWYNEWLGGEYEGGRMPWLYHHYIGHDNNRDFFMLTQAESRVVNDVLYHRWFPQAFLDEHQMGSTGPRMFVPPQTDPLAGEIHSLIFRQADLLGTNMSRRLEEAGKRGVGHNMIFDSYWPGGTRNTAWWKNVTGLLTEVASARLASPIFVDPGELRGGYKGLPEYTRRANYPSPWDGGWWRLRDIVDYELIATWAFYETLAENRRDILYNMYVMAGGEIEHGRTEPPFAFVFPPDQHDPVAAGKLVELLQRHGVQVQQSSGELRIGYSVYPEGTIVVPAAQPYRPFLLTMLRPQRYPEVRPYSDGPIIAPYDVTSWSLPISMGVEVLEATQPVRGELVPLEVPSWPDVSVDTDAAGHVIPHAADSAYPAMNRLLADGKSLYWLPDRSGDIYIPASEVNAADLQRLADELHVPLNPLTDAPTGPRWHVGAARVGLYKPWVASMDEGWTRWLLEQYEFPFVNLANEEIRSGEFTEKIDVLLVPDVDKAIIAAGKPAEDDERRRRFWTPLPPPYAGGIDEWPEDDGKASKGKKSEEEKGEGGGERIKRWVEEGGTVVALDSSTEYFIELFELPVQNVLSKKPREEFDCPGSMLRVVVDKDLPLTYGLREEEAVYFARSPAFATRVPDARFERRVIARYPGDDKDILVSGYLKGGELLEKRAAAVEIDVGKGRVVLIGFRAQHRAQPHRTFKLLFNALYERALESD
jgi:hypothetical protein